MKQLLTMLTCAVALAGCGPSLSTTDPNDKPAAKQASDADIMKYFQALAKSDPAEARKALKLAAPKSDAWAFAAYLQAFGQAESDAGDESEQPKISKSKNGLKWCPPQIADDNPCYQITDIKTKDGKISTFNTWGSPLKGRIILGNGKPVSLGNLGEATLIAAYVRPDHMNVVFEIKSEVDGLFGTTDTRYIGPDGRQKNTAGSVGPSELSDGATANRVESFDDAKLGGRVVLDMFSTEASGSVTAEFQLK